MGGTLDATLDGGQGDDTVTGSFALSNGKVVSPLNPPPRATIQEKGGAGRDALALAVTADPGPSGLSVSASLDGGAGTDTCTTAGSDVPVAVTNCER
jgi:hypothetical protein